MNVYLNDLSLICALGHDLPSIRANLFAGISPGMQATERYSPGRALTLGLVDAPLRPLESLVLPLRSRNNALLLAAWDSLRESAERAWAGLPKHRIAVVLGTSTSGIHEVEKAIATQVHEGHLPADFHYQQQELGSPAACLAQEIGAQGPAYCISSACTSSAKALASGARLLQAGLADVVIAGGVDTLAQFTVAGFTALESVSAARCLPFSANRCGINIGEGAALFLMTREGGPVRLAGWGESSDGHHISAPDPQGSGARIAIQSALDKARISAGEIGYVNLHGTATPLNDAMESHISAEFFPHTPASSTKALTGHTLGAAGAIEAGLCWLALTDPAHRLPPHQWDQTPDPQLPPLHFVMPGQVAAGGLKAAISHSFAFGGNNAALVLTR